MWYPVVTYYETHWRIPENEGQRVFPGEDVVLSCTDNEWQSAGVHEGFHVSRLNETTDFKRPLTKISDRYASPGLRLLAFSSIAIEISDSKYTGILGSSTE